MLKSSRGTKILVRAEATISVIRLGQAEVALSTGDKPLSDDYFNDAVLRLFGIGIIKGVKFVGNSRELRNAPKTTFRPDLEAHLTLRDTTVPRSSGIGGAHNAAEFNKAAAVEGINVTKRTPHPTVPGVEKVEYQIPALDRTGKPTGTFKAKVFEKTVYDPAKISDAEMLKWGMEAAEEAASRGALTREWNGLAKNGVTFRGYLDDTGAVRSFFPDF